MKIILAGSLALILGGCAIQTVNHGLLCFGICYDWINERTARLEAEAAMAEHQCHPEPEVQP